MVIVETARGREMGTVCIPNKEIEDEAVIQPLKPVIRRATPEDMISAEDNRAKEAEAYRICKERIQAHGLEMKLVEVEYTFDGSKVLFYFTADGRIDFRELVKDLASIFKTRIELRQIGVRDETKIMGGIGVCGRPLCCATWLNDFVPVSIKMAKEQNLSLNPTKISGVCGRLMCCLKHEEDTYEYLNSLLPDVGSTVTVAADKLTGTVQEVNVLRQKVKVLVNISEDETELKEYPVRALRFGSHLRFDDDLDVSDPEYEALEELEELEIQEEAEAGIAEGQADRRKNDRRRRDRRQRQNRQAPDKGGRTEDREGNEGNDRRRKDQSREADRSNAAAQTEDREKRQDRGGAGTEKRNDRRNRNDKRQRSESADRQPAQERQEKSSGQGGEGSSPAGRKRFRPRRNRKGNSSGSSEG